MRRGSHVSVAMLGLIAALGACDPAPRVGPEACTCVAGADPIDGHGLRFVPEGACHCLVGEPAPLPTDEVPVRFVSVDGSAGGEGTAENPWSTLRTDELELLSGPVLVRVGATDERGEPAVFEAPWELPDRAELSVFVDGAWRIEEGAWVPAEPAQYASVPSISGGALGPITLSHLRLGGGAERALDVPVPARLTLHDLIVDDPGHAWGVALGPGGDEDSGPDEPYDIRISSSSLTAGVGPALSIHGRGTGPDDLVRITDTVIIGGSGRGAARADGVELRSLVGGATLERVVLAGAARGIRAYNTPLSLSQAIVAASTEHGILFSQPTLELRDFPVTLRDVIVHGSRGDGITLRGRPDTHPLTAERLGLVEVTGVGLQLPQSQVRSELTDVAFADVGTALDMREEPRITGCLIDGSDASIGGCELGPNRPLREELSGPDRTFFTVDDRRTGVVGGGGGRPPQEIVLDGLVHRLPFEGSLEDVAGGAAAGGGSSGIFDVDPWGREQAALAPDGCASLSTVLPETDAVSMTMWLRPDREFGDFEEYGFAGIPGVSLLMRGRLWHVGVRRGGTLYYTTDDRPTTPGEWVHVGVVVDGPSGDTELYLNGQLASVGGHEIGSFGGSGSIVAGCGGDAEAIDEFRVYARALTAEEVLQLARR